MSSITTTSQSLQTSTECRSAGHTSQAITAKYVPPGKRLPGLWQPSWRTKQVDSSKEITESTPPLPSPAPSLSWRSSRRGSASSCESSSSHSSDASSIQSSSASEGTTSKNWRERAPRSPSPGCSSKPTFDNLCPGQVFHLPYETEVPTTSSFHDRTVRRGDNPWNHPVVILNKDLISSEELVLCRLATSFRKGEAFDKKPAHQKEKIVLCDNSQGVKAHMGTEEGGYTRMLTVEPGSAKFDKPTYVNFYDQENNGTFWIEYRYLQSWETSNGRPITFDQESLERIRNKQVR